MFCFSYLVTRKVVRHAFGFKMSITEGDVRKEFLLATIANYFSIPLKDKSIVTLNSNDKLNNFLDDGNALLLSANIEKRDDGNRILLDNAAHVGYTEDKVKHKHRHARFIFTVYAVFQNLLGGAVIFFNLTMLFRHFIYIA